MVLQVVDVEKYGEIFSNDAREKERETRSVTFVDTGVLASPASRVSSEGA